MQLSERVAKIIAEKSLSRAGLAELLGVDRTLVHKYLNGAAVPGAIPSLLLSALGSTEEERVFWIQHSGLSQAQFELLARALNVALPTAIDGSEVKLLEWWRHPNKNPMDGSIRSVVETAIGAWQARGKH